jgi:hypothetical protein
MPNEKQDRLSRLYHAGANEAPPPAIDARILRAAREHGQARAPRWHVPLSAAAVVVLAVGLYVFMAREGVTPTIEPPRDVARLEPAPAPAPVAQSGAESHPQKPAAEPPATAPAETAVSAGRGDLRETAPAAKARRAPGSTRSLAAKEEGAMMPSVADVVSVQVSGSAGAYQFNVTIRSPDTGCARYADWWEVVSLDGKLLYRRVLAHSHVDEQPFARSGGPVPIAPDTLVWVRAHMRPGGYGGAAFRGSVKNGFVPAPLPADFAATLSGVPPLPEDCAF